MEDTKRFDAGPLSSRGELSPPNTPLIEVICSKEKTKEYTKWVDWLQNGKVPDRAKLDQLHYRPVDSQGYSALHCAALHYCPDILSVASEIKGVNFNLKARDELTPFLVAAQNNNKNAVLWLLQDGSNLVDVFAVDGQKRNAIHLAALDMQCQYTIEALVRQLGDELCSLRDEDGNTPLHIAASNNNMQAIENGVLNPEIWDEDDDSDEEEGDSDDEAESDGEETELKKIICIQNNKKQTALHIAVEKGHQMVVRKILNIYPEAMLMKDKSLNLPLHIACKFDKPEIVKELLMTEVEEQGRKGRMRANKLQRLARELLEESKYNLDHEGTQELVKGFNHKNDDSEIARLLTELHLQTD